MNRDRVSNRFTSSGSTSDNNCTKVLNLSWRWPTSQQNYAKLNHEQRPEDSCEAQGWQYQCQPKVNLAFQKKYQEAQALATSGRQGGANSDWNKCLKFLGQVQRRNYLNSLIFTTFFTLSTWLFSKPHHVATIILCSFELSKAGGTSGAPAILAAQIVKIGEVSPNSSKKNINMFRKMCCKLFIFVCFFSSSTKSWP